MKYSFECLEVLWLNETVYLHREPGLFSSIFNDRNFVCLEDNLNLNSELYPSNFPPRKFSFKGIKIVVQPDSQAVLCGQVVKLCCWATGHPFVHYQWFKQKKEVIVDGEYMCMCVYIYFFFSW